MQETQETQVWSLGEENPLEKEMETQSSILARKIPWTEEPGGLQTKGLPRVRQDWATKRQESDRTELLSALTQACDPRLPIVRLNKMLNINDTKT